MSNVDLNIDALLNKAKKELNSSPDENAEDKDMDLRIEDLSDASFHSELNDAIELLTDPGYQRELLKLYTQVVNFDRNLCKPILEHNGGFLGSMELQNPFNIAIKKKLLEQNQEIINLLTVLVNKSTFQTLVDKTSTDKK